MVKTAKEILEGHPRLASVVAHVRSEVLSEVTKNIKKEQRDTEDKISKNLFKRFMWIGGILGVIYGLMLAGGATLYIDRFVLLQVGKSVENAQNEMIRVNEQLKNIINQIEKQSEVIDETSARLAIAVEKLDSLYLSVDMVRTYIISNADHEILELLNEVNVTESDSKRDPIRLRIYGSLAFIESVTPKYGLPEGAHLAKALKEIDAAFSTWLTTSTSDTKRLTAAKNLLRGVPSSSTKYRLLGAVASLEKNPGAASEYAEQAFQLLKKEESDQGLKMMRTRANWAYHHLTYIGQTERALNELSDVVQRLETNHPRSRMLGVVYVQIVSVTAMLGRFQDVEVALSRAYQALAPQGCILLNVMRDQDATEFEEFKKYLASDGEDWETVLKRRLMWECS